MERLLDSSSKKPRPFTKEGKSAERAEKGRKGFWKGKGTIFRERSRPGVLVEKRELLHVVRKTMLQEGAQRTGADLILGRGETTPCRPGKKKRKSQDFQESLSKGGRCEGRQKRSTL